MEAYYGAYCAHLNAVLGQVDPKAVAAVAEVLLAACEAGKTLYFIANGGSAACASHWVNDLVAGGYVEDKAPWRAFCLSDNVESVTALGNDIGYEDIFLHQVRCALQPGDVLVSLSVSGNSENIIRAVDYANAHGAAATIGFCGFDGGRLAKAASHPVLVPASLDEYGPVEDSFGVLEHILSGWLTMKRGKQLHH